MIMYYIRIVADIPQVMSRKHTVFSSIDAHRNRNMLGDQGFDKLDVIIFQNDMYIVGHLRFYR